MFTPSIHQEHKTHTTRLDRAQQILDDGLILPVGDSRTLFEVQSQSSAEIVYRVNVDAGTCEYTDAGETFTCPDRAKGHTCKHLLASQMAAALLTRSNSGEGVQQ